MADMDACLDVGHGYRHSQTHHSPKAYLLTNLSFTRTHRYIIDTGMHRDVVYDDRRGMPSLLCTWCSQASVKQRAGRAGRVAPGTVLHMYTKTFHDKCMRPFDEAEILRVPLEKTVLNVKILLSRFGRCAWMNVFVYGCMVMHAVLSVYSALGIWRVWELRRIVLNGCVRIEWVCADLNRGILLSSLGK